jgi:hypothetical protein
MLQAKFYYYFSFKLVLVIVFLLNLKECVGYLFYCIGFCELFNSSVFVPVDGQEVRNEEEEGQDGDGEDGDDWTSMFGALNIFRYVRP